MSQFLLLTRRDLSRDAEGRALFAAEAAAVDTLKQEGFIKSIWSRGDIVGACLLLEAPDEAQLRQTLQRLPLFEAGLLEIEALVPLRRY